MSFAHVIAQDNAKEFPRFRALKFRIEKVIVPGLDPRALRITTRVNGQVKQDSSTSDLIFDVATLISFCSQYMTLEAGDVISTGTPAGVGNLNPGDVVEVEIEGIGVLTNAVIG